MVYPTFLRRWAANPPMFVCPIFDWFMIKLYSAISFGVRLIKFTTPAIAPAPNNGDAGPLIISTCFKSSGGISSILSPLEKLPKFGKPSFKS